MTTMWKTRRYCFVFHHSALLIKQFRSWLNSLHLCFYLSNRAERSEPEFFVCQELLVFATEFMYYSYLWKQKIAGQVKELAVSDRARSYRHANNERQKGASSELHMRKTLSLF